jgi:8-oxo-dGTP diphosphatase
VPNRESPPLKRFRVSIYGILRDRAGRVLVTESAGAKGTFFNFPGGGIQLGEAPLDALHRELAEEVGLRVRPLRLLHASLQFHRGVIKPKQQMVGIYWLVERTGGRLKRGNGDDVVGVRWAHPRELYNFGFTSFDREALLPIVKALA